MKKIIFILILNLIILEIVIAKPIDKRLFLAAKRGKLELVKKLLKKDINVNFETFYYSETPLIVASEKGYVEIVKILLENGADPNIISCPYHYMLTIFDFRYDTALLRAVDNEHKQIILLLIKYGADVNYHQICYGWDAKPLILAQKKGYKDIEKILLEAGANSDLNFDE